MLIDSVTRDEKLNSHFQKYFFTVENYSVIRTKNIYIQLRHRLREGWKMHV